MAKSASNGSGDEPAAVALQSPSASSSGAHRSSNGCSETSKALQLQGVCIDEHIEKHVHVEKSSSVQTPLRVQISHTISHNISARGSVLKQRSLKLGRRIRPFVTGRSFKGTVIGALIIALLGNPFLEIADLPDDPYNNILDIIMVLIGVLFAVEVVLNCICSHRGEDGRLEYPFSFFFWMDVLGTLSMVFEVSWMPMSPVGKYVDDHADNAESMGTQLFDSVVLRTARLAKVGARVGRIHRGLQTLWSMLGFYKGAAQDSESMRGLSHQLMLSLSSKVSILTIIFVFALPLFNLYDSPERDWSGATWVMWLEQDYTRSCIEARGPGNGTSLTFEDTVGKMRSFYDNKPPRLYSVRNFPKHIEVDGVALHIPGEFEDTEPKRRQNVQRQRTLRHDCCGKQAEGCANDPEVRFDFTMSYQREAAMDVGMFLFMVLIMVVSSYDIQRTVNRKVVLPLERIFEKVRTQAKKMKLDTNEPQAGADGYDVDAISETKLLETIIAKMAELTELMSQQHCANDEELAKMDAHTMGVLNDLVAMPEIRRTLHSTCSYGSRSAFANHRRSRLQSNEDVVTELPTNMEILESWSLDVLQLKDDQLNQLVLWIFFDSHVKSFTTRSLTPLSTFHNFHGKVRASYNKLPYHCYSHACDVLFTVYRELSLTHAPEWLGDDARYALLVAALCHDLGHPGFNNAFLVESENEWAVRYNDKSPLENMHCVKLFDICKERESDIFSAMDKEKRREVRKTCIETILHTDMEHHLSMVQEMAALYLNETKACDQAAICGKEEPLPQEYYNILVKKPMVFMKLFLHLADVSNPLKPFSMCEQWAYRCLDEFFSQGDKERELGLPIGNLNDKGKVNKPGSQHVFINFVVAPLAKPAVQIFAPLHELTSEMVKNLTHWRNKWVDETHPPEDEIIKRDGEIQRWAKEAAELRQRVRPP